jgi:hypothetical protein
MSDCMLTGIHRSNSGLLVESVEDQLVLIACAVGQCLRLLSILLKLLLKQRYISWVMFCGTMPPFYTKFFHKLILIFHVNRYKNSSLWTTSFLRLYFDRIIENKEIPKPTGNFPSYNTQRWHENSTIAAAQEQGQPKCIGSPLGTNIKVQIIYNNSKFRKESTVWI